MGNHSHTFPHSDTLQGESLSLPEDPSRPPSSRGPSPGPWFGQSRRCIAGLRTNSTGLQLCRCAPTYTVWVRYPHTDTLWLVVKNTNEASSEVTISDVKPR